MWEDPINAKGGKWIFTNPRSRKARLDECWLYVVRKLHDGARVGYVTGS
jgi:translation initiation factor 4E